LEYHEDPKEYVYDFTVPGNDSFMVDDNILVHNTLNSVDFHTEIVIAKDGKIVTPKIGEFIDDYIKTCDQSKIQYLPNDQIYVPLEDGHNWMAASCDESGKMMWTKLEAITKHPVINDDGTDTILEVETESGRVVKATKAKSFLIHRDGKIIDCNGSDLKIGDELPIANSLALGDLGLVDTLDLRTVLSAKEYLFGDEVAKAVAALKKADEEGNRHWFSHANGVEFTVPYNRSDTFRAAFTQGLNTRAAEFLPGFVYPKSTRSCSSHIPAVIPLTRDFGFLVGAFIAEGSTSTTQIQITNNDDSFLAPIRTFLEGWKIGHHTVKKEVVIESTGIKGTTQSLIIHSTILTMVFRQLFGVLAHNKTMPDWVTQAPDVFVHGLVDGYFSGDGTVCGKTGSVHASSVSKDLLTRMSLLLSRYGIFSTMSSYMPEIRKFKSVHMSYKMSIIPKYAKVFGETFTLLSKHKQDRLNVFKGIDRRCRREECLDVVLDKVKSIAMVHPWGGKVYDITVETTRNFLIQNGTNLKDTFHLSGVASKSAMTRGVPRLKELMKSTKNPKAIELTIPLRADLRDKKEEARRVAQELEFTLLQDLVTTSRIYYDPRDSDTLLREDADWLAYLAAFEQLSTTTMAATQQPDPLNSSSSGAAAAAATLAAVKPQSPWMLRFELDRERMFAKDITMDDIAFLLKKYAEVKVLYSDYNATRLVFRVRPDPEELAENKTMDDLNVLKALQNRMLGTTAVRGIHGLRSVNYQKVSDTVEFKDGKYQTIDQYILTSDGSNFIDVLTHPDVDPTRVVSSNVHDMFENLGIEATRATLYKEITTLFAESGSSVNYRHICILLDKICHKGKTMSVDRYGVNKSDIGPLAKMSFEQTEEIVLKAAVFGERDPCLGVSAKVMLGAPIRAGTAFTELMLDEEAAIKLAESTPEQIERGGRMGPGELTEQAMYDALYGEDVPGPCSLSYLLMIVEMTPASEDVLPETIEDVEITLID
jgi:DNA-directed RNA polymerase beta' subunit